MEALHALTRAEELEYTMEDSLTRGLVDNAMWCGEMLVGMEPRNASLVSTFTGRQPFDAHYDPIPAPRLSTATRPSAGEESDEVAEDLESVQDLESHAATLLQSGEPLRAWHVLKETQNIESSSKTMFLYFWSQWKAGEEVRQQAYLEKSVLLSEKKPENPYAAELYGQLTLLHSRGQLDAYCLYLYGLLLLERGQKEDALGVLLRAVAHRPLLWVAWKDIAMMAGVEVIHDVRAIFPAPHWSLGIFEAYLLLRNYKYEEAMQRFLEIRNLFPTASPVGCWLGSAAYDCGVMEEAKAYFECVVSRDPYRIEDLDHYSNALYMFSEEKELSLLAHRTALIQPLRPETMCILGNLYSLNKESEKSVQYFLRALQLDHRCQNAWTFLGHEYSPYQGGIGNVKACVFAYQRALELFERDFRAWLGLAQIYYSEFSLPIHASYYAESSVAMRPNDARLRKIADMMRQEACNKVKETSTPHPAEQWLERIGQRQDASMTPNTHSVASGSHTSRASTEM